MTTQMIIRIDDALKQRATAAAKSEGKNVSEVVREMLEEYVVNRDLAGVIDDIWSRAGNSIRQAGFKASDVDGIIRNVRAGK